MSQGFCYRCSKCNHEYAAYPGMGMAYPSVYRETVEQIAAGKFGTEIQNVFNSTLYAAINAETVIYLCAGCGEWESTIDLTVYAPDDPQSIPQMQFGIKTVSEWGYVPYVTRSDLKNHYHLKRRYYPQCSKCGRRMHKASPAELENLPCPECSSKNQAAGIAMWD